MLVLRVIICGFYSYVHLFKIHIAVVRIRRFPIWQYRYKTMDHRLPIAKSLSHWRCDDVVLSMICSEEYEESTTRRIRKLHRFIRSSHVATDVLRVAIPSIHV